MSVRIVRPARLLLARLLLIAALALSIAPPVEAIPPRLEMHIADAAGVSGDSSVLVDVHMISYFGNIVAFQLRFDISDPGLASFDWSVVSTGTLTEGWSFKNLGSGDFVRFQGHAPGGGDIWPQPGDTPLVRLKLDLAEVPEPSIASVQVLLKEENLNISELWILNDNGDFVGTTQEMSVDTTYLLCEAWAPPDSENCLSWTVVHELPFDSMAIDSNSVPVYRDSLFRFTPGAVQILATVCGDIDGTVDGLVTLGDLNRMIAHLFGTLEPLPYPIMGNLDSSLDGRVTLSDLTILIDHLFISIEPLECGGRCSV